MSDGAASTCPICGIELWLPPERSFLPTVCGACHGSIPARRNLGRFRLHHFVHRGGLGVVYAAYDPVQDIQTEVNVMQLRPDMREQALHDFARTADSLLNINHPHLARIDGFGFEPGLAYISQEPTPGRTLRHRLNQRSRLGLAEVLTLGLQAAVGLEAASKVGVRHAQLTPASFHFTGAGQLKLKGFSAAILYEELAAVNGLVHGQLCYHAPELLLSGQLDVRTDIYALGAVLFHALTGSPPYDAEAHGELLLERMQLEPPQVEVFLPRISPLAANLFNRLIQPFPEHRFADWPQVCAALQRVSELLN